MKISAIRRGGDEAEGGASPRLGSICEVHRCRKLLFVLQRTGRDFLLLVSTCEAPEVTLQEFTDDNLVVDLGFCFQKLQIKHEVWSKTVVLE